MENTDSNSMSVFSILNSAPPSYHPEMPFFSPIVPIEQVTLQQNVIDIPPSEEPAAAPKRRGRPPATKTKAKSKNSPKRQKAPIESSPTDKNSCPICSQKLTKATFDEHMKMELARIQSNESSPSIDSLELLVPETQQRTRRGAAVHARKKVQNLIQNDDDDPIPSNQNSSSSETLKSLRNNRTKRTTTTEKRTNHNTTNTSSIRCPICNASFDRDFDINLHIDSCLQPTSTSTSSTSSSSARPVRKTRSQQQQQQKKEEDFQDEIQDEEEEEGVETYTWGGQTRIRTCSLLQEGYTGFDGEKLKKVSAKEEEDELDIEEDSQTFGKSQYSEMDLITLEDENNILRERVIETEIHPEKPPNSPSHHYSTDITRNEEPEPEEIEKSTNVVIESLKAKIREQNKLLASSYKCLICLDQYQVPLVSVTCWHVHCEKCWLASLGAKKLCPQCKAITSPADLRKIFM